MYNQRILKKGLLIALIISLLAICTSTVLAQEAPIKLFVNGDEVATDVPPQLIDNRTMVPVRFVSEALGASVTWNEEKQAVLINSDESQADPRGNAIQLIVNGKKVTTDVPPMTIDYRTMVPVRFVSEALGAEVNWDQAARTVSIQDATPKAPSEKIVIEDGHVIDRSKETIEERYANAKQVSILDILDVVTIDEGIKRDGKTFINTLESKGSNRYIRIGVDNGEGLIDLTELNGNSGQIAVHINASIDVSQTTNGMYFTMKNDLSNEDSFVTPQPNIDWRDYTDVDGAFDHMVRLETTLWDIDNAYIEILLPYQAEMTIHDIFMFVEKEVPGFGDMHERITGGAEATAENIHLTHNAAEFVAAVDKVKAAQAPSIIYLDGTITYEDLTEVTGTDEPEISFGKEIQNLSIIGVADRGVFDGAGIKIHGHNVIVENLTFQYVEEKDALQINNATDVWVRHNSFIDGGRELPEGVRSDELMSIKNNSQHVIVSWNHFKDSNRVMLVGSNDGIGALPDRRLIMHHNFIENVTQRVPLYRGGHAHIYNNYIKNVNGSGSNVRSNAKMRFENNVYEDVKNPIGDFHGHIPGRWEVSGNEYINSTGSQPTESTIEINFKDYEYELDPTDKVIEIVTQGAGAGKIEQDLSFLN